MSSLSPTAVASSAGTAAPGSGLRWILRVGLAACFIGHGALGLDRTAAWTSYFAVVGIGREHALALMPWVGAFDVAMALSVLLLPMRGVILYMTGWALWTALLRPLAGESSWEAIERAGNYGVPLALSLVLAPDGGLPARLGFPGVVRLRERLVPWILRLTTVLLLLGHGTLGCLVAKPMFRDQYTMLGLPGATVELWVGGFECFLALAVLFRPTPRLLLGVVAWKLATEALCPLAGSPVWVWVEHGGSYAAPLALAWLGHRGRATAPPESGLVPSP